MTNNFDAAFADDEPTPFQLAYEGLLAQLRAITVALRQLAELELSGQGNKPYIDSQRGDLKMKYAAKAAERDILLTTGAVHSGPTADEVARLREAVRELGEMNATAAQIKGIVDELVTIADAVLYRPAGAG